MTDEPIGRQAGRPRARWRGGPWYHQPEWIIAAMAVASMGVAGATGLSKGQAQTALNTRDIGELRAKVDPMPERLGRIEQKVDDILLLEKRRRDRAD